MIRVNINNPRGYRNIQEVIEAVQKSSGLVKLICGACNNATFLVMCDAHDKVKPLPRYQGKAGFWFRKAFKDWRMYEYNLLYAEKNRFFHVADMFEETRQHYGENFTDAQYFEFWQGAGAPVYSKTKNYVSSLAWKYSLSLQQHGVDYAKEVGWALAASACLYICDYMWRLAVDEIISNHGLPRQTMYKVFTSFRVNNIYKAWNNAVDELCPAMRGYELSESEQIDIQRATDLLAKMWTSPEIIYDAAKEGVEDYQEIWKSAIQKRKSLIQLEDLKQQTIEELKKDKTKRIIS